VKLKVFRDRQERDIAVTLAESPPNRRSRLQHRLGVSVDQLAPQVAPQLN
jgi:hypothetical protein